MIINYLLLLILGYLLGNFYINKDKINGKFKDKKIKCVLIHFIKYYIVSLFTIIPIFSLDMFLAVTYASASYLVIDTIICVFLIKRVSKNYMLFIIGQSMHLISLLLLAYVFDNWNFTIGHITILSNILGAYGFDSELFIRWLLAILFIHKPVNLFINYFLEDYKPKDSQFIIKADNRAGRRIGTIERLIMLIFLSKNQYAAIGFVLTAKSIARYDKITKHEKFAEYYLLGTLLSTLCVIICRIIILL